MMKMQEPLISLLEDPPREDSEDFTSEEAHGALVTTNAGDLADHILGHVREGRYTVRSHELRRRGGHLYSRTRLASENEPDRFLLCQIDWVDP